jgi:hypothetical protein
MSVVAAISAVFNVLLLVLLFYVRQWRNYKAGMDGSLDREGLQWYALMRYDDVSGVSGEGLVCEVARFSDGHAALHWINSKYPWTTPCPEGLDAIMEIHGHGGKTRLVPINPL